MSAVVQEYKHPEYLVETDWLEQHLDTAGFRVFDCTVNVAPNPDPEQGQKIPFVYKNGRDNFYKAHIPHAGFIDILDDLSDVSSSL